MQRLDLYPVSDVVEMHCLPDGDDEIAPLVVIELRVPPAATVPALRPRTAALPVVRQASVTSTVLAAYLVQLRANNTAQARAWCTTATLAFGN